MFGDLAAYVHPVFMVGVIVLGGMVLREGLALRRARLKRRRWSSARHRRLARPFVLLVAAGWVAGLGSMAFLRQQPVFDSVHFPLVTTTLLAVGVAGAIGLRLERAPQTALLRIHALSGALALLAALLGAVAGFAILP